MLALEWGNHTGFRKLIHKHVQVISNCNKISIHLLCFNQSNSRTIFNQNEKYTRLMIFYSVENMYVVNICKANRTKTEIIQN